MRFREALIQSARTVGERFFVQSRYQKRRNTVCTRKGYAASVSRLVPATAALYFPLFGTEAWAEKIRSQSQTIYSEVPQILATPDFRAASATAFATAGPTLGSKAAGMI